MKAQNAALGILLALSTACRQSSSSKEPDHAQAQARIQELDAQVDANFAAAQVYSNDLEESSGGYKAAIDQLQSQYSECADSGRKSFQPSAVQSCADVFEQSLKYFLLQMVDEYRSVHTVDVNNLNGKILTLADKGTPIGEDLDVVMKTYNDCQEQALQKPQADNPPRMLRACELTVSSELTRIKVATDSAEVNPLDTW